MKEGEKGGERHKGLKKISSNDAKIKNHIKKAIHNFNAISDFHELGYSDWSASACFYALYHCLLAILAKYGYESRNQNCTFAFVEDKIIKGELSITVEDLKEIFDKDIKEDIESSDKLLDLREKMQYSIKTSMEEREFEELKKRTKELFDKLRQELEK